MAKVNTGKVVEIKQFQKDCRMITMDVKEISFIGGQYIIVNSGVKLGEDKFAKASYTLCSPTSSPEKVSIIVNGAGSVAVSALPTLPKAVFTSCTLFISLSVC